MPARLPSDLLNRPAREASRVLALSYLDQIDRAQRRLGDSLDPEALHDFRVGLRRFRSCLRAYRVPLKGSVTGRMRSEVRELARATNAGRDTEVQLAWLRAQAGQLGAEDTAGFFWLVGRLEGRKQETHDADLALIARRYTKAALRFRRALGTLRIELDDGRAQRLATFGEVTGGLLRQQVARFQAALGRIRDASDAEAVHRARIAAKRLRYLLEPLSRGNRRAGAIVRRLKEAQDLLGQHHDMHVLTSSIASLRTGSSGSSFSEVENGLAILARFTIEEATVAFERFHSLWGGDLANRILTRAEDLGKSLEQPALLRNGISSLTPEPAVSPLARLNVRTGDGPGDGVTAITAVLRRTDYTAHKP